MSKYSNRRRGSKNVKQGAAGEDVAATVLWQLGLVRIRRIESAWTVIRWLDAAKHIAIVFPSKKVDGDFTAMTPEGKGVLIEVKTVDDRNLRWSDFKDHQIEALDDHSQYSLALVVFVFRPSPGYAILEWPISGFKKGKGLSIERALELSISSLDEIRS